MTGWKTWTGAAFIALTAFLGALEGIVAPETLVIWQAISGAIGAFLATVGIGHKVDKINE